MSSSSTIDMTEQTALTVLLTDDAIECRCEPAPFTAMTQRIYAAGAFGTGVALCTLTGLSVVLPWYYGTNPSAAHPPVAMGAPLYTTIASVIGSNLFTTIFCSATLLGTAVLLGPDMPFMSRVHLALFVLMRTMVIIMTRQRITSSATEHCAHVRLGGNSEAIAFNDAVSIVAWASVSLEVILAFAVLVTIGSHVQKEEEEQEEDRDRLDRNGLLHAKAVDMV